MSKKPNANRTPNAVDADGIYFLSPQQVKEQTEFLDSLPKDQQIKLAAEASGMTVMELLMQIAMLHQTAEDAEAGLFHQGIPCADPILFEYITPTDD